MCHYNSIKGYDDRRFESFGGTVVAAIQEAVPLPPGDEAWTFKDIKGAQQGPTSDCAAFTLLHMLICLPSDTAVATAALVSSCSPQRPPSVGCEPLL